MNSPRPAVQDMIRFIPSSPPFRLRVWVDHGLDSRVLGLDGCLPLSLDSTDKTFGVCLSVWISCMETREGGRSSRQEAEGCRAFGR
uniref:Uncharacterized protein n=1 Tax=Chromera velia CCMP2878 TaxID=1169474 RepID=A0A0G4HNX5_9ALVE|eukprot:Cvel_29633.t1-p1 / transcript=Cvel_29633.t1 / gene=Cvel_29633 / organism=Chromera_velia_CCMP2878 / gene_product=hypothetical protein / transcript_product=hypothetical protein / location=Cvel_scaffold4090:6550-8791(+) / protein_length=85 / sequence_SO=supercontig / SO=protein_coding / is_pseudo=false